MNDSPMKKINFDVGGKENAVSSADVDLKADKVEKPTEAPKVAPGIKDLEASEPLLQENPHRFVLFPIKYHEVSRRVTRKVVPCMRASTNKSTDLADVQEGRSLVLDRRRDRSIQGPP